MAKKKKRSSGRRLEIVSCPKGDEGRTTRPDDDWELYWDNLHGEMPAQEGFLFTVGTCDKHGRFRVNWKQREILLG